MVFMLDFNFQKTLHRNDGSHFTLDIRLCCQSQRTVIMGASGSGKSLMLKAVAGLLTPEQGHINVNGVTLFQAQQHINLSLCISGLCPLSSFKCPAEYCLRYLSWLIQSEKTQPVYRS